MKKAMMLIMVLGLAVLAADRMGLTFDNSAAADNTPMVTCSDVVHSVQSDDGSVCIVYLEITDVGRPDLTGAFTRADIFNQLPDATTLVLLGFGGLLYRRRKA